jgi:hypothetical protein
VPALVLHGAADVMCDVSGGRATATAIPGAELVIIDGMGHTACPASYGRIWPPASLTSSTAPKRSRPSPDPPAPAVGRARGATGAAGGQEPLGQG